MQSTDGFAHAALAAGVCLNAAIYDRVSDDPTGQRRSVEEQDERNRATCADKGWHLAETAVYCDNDRSASRYATKPRPDWGRLREDVAAFRYHVVVLWEVSRGDRDDLSWIGFLHMCRRIGVLIHITSHYHTYDPRLRRDYKTLAEEGLDSADESARTSERIRRDTEAMADKGRPHGPVPYGYRREYGIGRNGRRFLIGQYPDEELLEATSVDGVVTEYSKAGIVREIFERLLGGERCRAIAGDLNRRGVPAPWGRETGWRDRTVKNVALKPAYAGMRSHKGRIAADGIWEPLVTKKDFYTLAGRFGEPERRTRRETSIKYLGSGLYVCGVCGSTLRVVLNKKKGCVSYSCRPKKVLARTPEEKRRNVTDEELETLRGLERREQTARILDLVRTGVTQVSVAKGLGLTANAVNWRIKREAVRRGESTRSTSSQPRLSDERYLLRGMHVSRGIERVDNYVQAVVCMRLLQPDLMEMMRADDSRADQRTAALATEIAEKQVRLDQARDAFATGSLSLQSLVRIEGLLEAEINTARAKLNQSRLGPVVSKLLHPTLAEVEAAWWRLSMPQRREVIRALIERVEILQVRVARSYTDEESVRIVWRQPNASGE